MRTLDELLRPLRDEIDALDAEIAKVQPLRERRTKLARILAAADRPSGVRPKAKAASTPSVSMEKQDALLDWLRGHRNGGQTFTYQNVFQDPLFDLGISDQTLRAGFAHLHERDLLTLVKLEGRIKHWRLSA